MAYEGLRTLIHNIGIVYIKAPSFISCDSSYYSSGFYVIVSVHAKAFDIH